MAIAAFSPGIPSIYNVIIESLNTCADPIQTYNYLPPTFTPGVCINTFVHHAAEGRVSVGVWFN